MLSLPYLALGRIFELLVLLGRSRERKELEILVLRHELRVLRTPGRRSPLPIARSGAACRAVSLTAPRSL
ncbi:MAG: hypothetical protein ACHP7P_14725, partial [Terriglobales bacterium]